MTTQTTERSCKTCKHDDDENVRICSQCDRDCLTGWAYPIKKAVYIRPEHDFYEAKEEWTMTGMQFMSKAFWNLVNSELRQEILTALRCNLSQLIDLETLNLAWLRSWNFNDLADRLAKDVIRIEKELDAQRSKTWWKALRPSGFVLTPNARPCRLSAVFWLQNASMIRLRIDVVIVGEVTMRRS